MRMPKVLRPLALANAAVALAFAIPLLVFVTVDYFSRGSMLVQIPAAETKDQTLARIQSEASIEDLRRQAKVLAELRAFDRMHQEVQGRLVDRMFWWFWASLGIVSAIFLANSGVLFWAHVHSASSRVVDEVKQP